VVGTGFSNGGFLLEHAAAVTAVPGSPHHGLFSAVVPVGGHQYGNWSKGVAAPPSPLAVFIAHATADGSVKYQGCCATSKCCCEISDRCGSVCFHFTCGSAGGDAFA